MRKLLSAVFIIVIFLSGMVLGVCHTAYALRTDYGALTTIRNPSIRAKKVIADPGAYIPYYTTYKKITVFGADEQSVSLIAKEAENAFEKIAKYLAMSVNQRKSVRPVIFILGERLWRTAALPSHAAAFYSPGHHEIFVRITGGEDRVFESLVHELTHLGIDVCGRKMPLWYEEGFSQYMPQAILYGDGLVAGKYFSLTELKNIVNKVPLRIEKLVTARDYNFYNNRALFYEISYQLVRLIYMQGDLSDFSYAYLHKKQDFISAFRLSVNYRSNTFSTIEQSLVSFINES